MIFCRLSCTVIAIDTVDFTSWILNIERSLFAFIWKYSKRDQLLLLIVTLTLFPLLFLTLELPKRIINDAIGADSDSIDFFGTGVAQVTYLFLLCGLFLLAVLCHGLMKMRINTMKGILAERLLRRFRYTLIARLLRFPAPYFERTSQGELVSMVTSESEPLGGLMGDAVAQPVLQAGQMLTILGFLFVQNLAFGLAACALIPLQAWLIPKLQRQVNLLNKSRVVQVRALAGEIGEGATGAATLRLHGGWRYRLALVSDRLSKLFFIRFEIFKKKFFMKFLNNFITQLTPFLFYAIGGYLAIRGDITIGALVAALAAYKDLSSPWKELLAYYNQHQDMSLRWDMITEKFAPPGALDPVLFDEVPDDIPALKGDVVLSGVSVRDADAKVILDDISVTFPAGSMIAISAQSDEDRRAFCDLLTREVLPASGTLSIAGYDLSQMHQSVLANRIGHASSRPVLFSGTLGANILMPLQSHPMGEIEESNLTRESAATGNSQERPEADWLNFDAAGVADMALLRAWWVDLVKGMGSADALFARSLDLSCDPKAQPELVKALVALRPTIADKVVEAGLQDHVCWLDWDAYNPAFPVLDNLLFSAPLQSLSVQILSEQTDFLTLLTELNLEDNLVQLAVTMVDMLRAIFGLDGTDHPLFTRLGLDAADYEQAVTLVSAQRHQKTLTSLEKAQLLIVPFSISAEVMGSSFPEEITDQVLAMRKSHGAALQANMDTIFAPITVDQPVLGLSVLENGLLGKISQGAGRNRDAVRGVVATVLRDADLEGAILGLIFDTPVGLGGTNLPAQVAETLALSRACIKRPDVLILDSVMSTHDASARSALYANLRELLPETTLICLEPSFDAPDDFDQHLEMKQGRIQADDAVAYSGQDETSNADLDEKIRVLRQSDMFSALDRKQLRLLAFGARWHRAKAAEYLFYKDDDPSSGAYLIVDGEAELRLPNAEGEDTLISTVGPGTLVGELGLIRNVPRALDMQAKADLTSLRIGAEEFLAVVENDATTAYKLLQVVAGYVGS